MHVPHRVHCNWIFRRQTEQFTRHRVQKLFLHLLGFKLFKMEQRESTAS